MWWLCYVRNGALLGVAIVEADSLSEARIRASLAELGRGGTVAEGYRLDERCRSLLTPRDIGRMLSPAWASALIERFERDEPKRPPAPSIRRRSERAQRA
jgi:hypothetical protein